MTVCGAIHQSISSPQAHVVGGRLVSRSHRYAVHMSHPCNVDPDPIRALFVITVPVTDMATCNDTFTSILFFVLQFVQYLLHTHIHTFAGCHRYLPFLHPPLAHAPNPPPPLPQYQPSLVPFNDVSLSLFLPVALHSFFKPNYPLPLPSFPF